MRIDRGGGDQAKPLSVPEIIDGFSGNSPPFRLQPLVQVPFLRRGEHTDHSLSARFGQSCPNPDRTRMLIGNHLKPSLYETNAVPFHQRITFAPNPIYG